MWLSGLCSKYRRTEEAESGVEPMTKQSIKRISEAEFTAQVIELAHLLGWRVAHFRPAWTNKGWRTPVQGDGKGFPDLVMVKGERLIFAELKSETGRMTPEQDAWHDALRPTGALMAVFYPRHWDVIVEILSETDSTKEAQRDK